MQLSSDHHIENELYYSDVINEVYNLLGEEREISSSPKEGKWKWIQLLEFLDIEIKIQQ